MPAAAGVVLSLADIAARLGGDVFGDPQTLICQVATLASAGEGEIGFLTNLKYKNQLKTTKAAWTQDGPSFSYDEVDTSLIQPRARRYDVDNTKKTDAAQATKGAK